MLADFVKLIVGYGREADRAQVIEVPGHRKTIIRRGSEFETLDHEPPTRRNGYDSLESLLAAILDAKICSDPEVYVSRDQIRAYTNRADRRECVHMRLAYTDQFAALTSLATESKNGAQMVRHLRFNLPSVPQCVIDGLRRIDFTRTSSGHRTAEHGRETYGRAVEADVQQRDKIPEQFEVAVPVFRNQGLRSLSTVTVQVGIHIDMENERIMMAPLADEIPSAIDRALEAIRGELADSTTLPIFMGSMPDPFRGNGSGSDC